MYKSTKEVAKELGVSTTRILKWKILMPIPVQPKQSGGRAYNSGFSWNERSILYLKAIQKFVGERDRVRWQDIKSYTQALYDNRRL